MYNPFNKTISEIEYKDLDKLIKNNISEGWFIEYKSSFPKNNKIANSIASFANSEGGWYIVGIEEKENESSPSEIVGIDIEDNKKPTDKITNIIKDNITPIPYFESKIVNMSNDKAVLIVQVFEGHDAPYISNGSIYIRVGETSKPVAIDDRYQFDKLLNKQENFKNRVNSFMDNEFFFDDNINQPYIEFYIYVNSPKNILFEDFYSKEFFEKFKENFNSNVELLEKIDISVPVIFDNAYSSVNSYILRHIYDNPLLHTGFTLELFKEGHLKLIYPFNIYGNAYSLNNKYETLDYYHAILSKYGNDKHLQIIDLGEAMTIFQCILAQYKRLLKEYDCDYELNVKYKFNNFNSVTPFVDSKEFMEFIWENKLPINLKSSINIPDTDYLKCQINDFNEIDYTLKIAMTLGVSGHLKNVIADSYIKYITLNAEKSDDEN